ncbi:ATP-binding protein [Actinomadura geliboluensis]|uniref:ATP-binding protein n=1 Tax=Actinomadura geliboluensis TaxID=882440 RepID=UPI00367AADDD
MIDREAGELRLLAVLTLPGVERSVRHARLLLRDTLAPDHIAPGDALPGDMALVLDEFACNGIRHTASGRGGKIHISLQAGAGALRAEVSDEGAGGARPVLRDAADGESGRGLLISRRSRPAGGTARMGPAPPCGPTSPPSGSLRRPGEAPGRSPARADLASAARLIGAWLRRRDPALARRTVHEPAESHENASWVASVPTTCSRVITVRVRAATQHGPAAPTSQEDV